MNLDEHNSTSVDQPQQHRQGEFIHQHLNHQPQRISVTPMGDHIHSESGSHEQSHHCSQV